MSDKLAKRQSTEPVTYVDRIKAQAKVETVKLVNTATSADGYEWERQENLNIAGLLENLVRGERVFVRAAYVEDFGNGKTSLPKSGPIFELRAVEMRAPKLEEKE